MSVVALIFFLVVGGALYFLPTIVARNGDRAGLVFVLNLFLGWTLIGWVAAAGGSAGLGIGAGVVEPPLGTRRTPVSGAPEAG